RLALLRDDSHALATAIAWGKRGATWETHPEAFYTADREISIKNVGKIGLNHCATGLHCVRTLIALAGGDFSEAERWAAAFERSTRVRSPHFDLTLGRAGLLLACAMIDEASPRPNEPIRALGNRFARAILRHVAAAGPIATSRTIPA